MRKKYTTDKELLDIEEKAVKKYFKKVLETKDDFSMILIAHLYVEHWIEVFIRYSLRKPGKILDSVRLTFLEKLALAESLGFDLDNEGGLAEAIKKLNTIRNKITHNIEYKLSKGDLKLITTLKFGSKKEHQELAKKLPFPRAELFTLCFALQSYVIGFIEGRRDRKRGG